MGITHNIIGVPPAEMLVILGKVILDPYTIMEAGQVEKEEMPVIAGYRLTTSFLRNYFAGTESFARKRAFLEYMLDEKAEGGGDDE